MKTYTVCTYFILYYLVIDDNDKLLMWCISRDISLVVKSRFKSNSTANVNPLKSNYYLTISHQLMTKFCRLF